MNYLNYCTEALIQGGKDWADFLTTVQDNFVCRLGSNINPSIKLITGDTLDFKIQMLDNELTLVIQTELDIELSHSFVLLERYVVDWEDVVGFKYHGRLSDNAFLNELFFLAALLGALPNLPGVNQMEDFHD